MDRCIFCDVIAGRVPARIVHRDELVVAFEDIHPQAPVHILVVPARHVASLNDTGPDDAPLLGSLLATARALARARGAEAKGYRLVVNTMAGAGQTVFHLHVHLLAGRPFSWPPG